ncbi:nucleoside 2-deoxyribosyltransferase [Clostridium sp.]|uniref:nucleoside 2-deoxyribosyltransferase n=1 Tax=Clostridium sp. TaxID=1506 RepID=UPI001B14A2B3|nr:nucleoside 2-deoxyribosyltransferase [Clostridium sp.]MBO5425462.1 nucleoside 2-deoxyribosyltransferase [Lachnospiraceae bacterium]MBP3906787.1 nucleoside 2-deoxyribosyltransferase [Peptostreptococcaceae bacterium]MBP3915537.1 nucleoside 2-deoxyribosyltransferase [Clostridium sp.]
MKKVYLASPFFDDAELERVDKVKEILNSKGLDVFSPKEHQNEHLEFGSIEWRKATFENDVKHIDWCDVVVAIICKGNYDDSGTAWELGYAYATNKPVVLVNITGETINLMIADSIHALITSYDELKEYDFEKMEKKPYLNYVW